jgi:hypothetical protein
MYRKARTKKKNVTTSMNVTRTFSKNAPVSIAKAGHFASHNLPKSLFKQYLHCSLLFSFLAAGALPAVSILG